MAKVFTQAPDMDMDSNNSGEQERLVINLSGTGLPLLQHPPSVTNFIDLMSVKRIHLSVATISPIIQKILTKTRTQVPFGYHLPLKLPINSDRAQTNAFSLAINVIEFGVRAYVVENNSSGTVI